jgi:hypothetical protein
MPVTLAIPLDLGGPELDVRLGNRSMLRATVPEASVNKDGHVGAAEREVRSSRKVKRMPKVQLGSRSGSSNPSH